jgi:molybdopterin-guanine dinucleotide biosynthesis protein A
MERTLGILLAGGRGERLRLGRPKALVLLGGETLLERACRTLRQVCDDLVVVAPADITLPLASGAGRLLDPGEGPLGGLAAASTAPAFLKAVVLGVDFPLVRAATLTALLERLGARSAVLPMPGGRAQPLVAAYSVEALAVLAGAFARGERSVVRAVETLDPLRLDDAALQSLPGGLESFLDVDTPDALADVERRLRAAVRPS